MKTSKGIYKIVSPRGSIYIGMTTVSFSTRWKQHLKNLRAKKSHKCRGLQRAFDKYGENGLVFEILEVLDYHSDNEIMQREIYWWDFYKIQGVNIYNGKPTGTGSVIHTDETKEKIGFAAVKNAKYKGKFLRSQNPNFCETCGKSLKGKSETSKYCSIPCVIYVNNTPGKIDYISKDEVVSAIQRGGTYIDISERLGIKKSSFYTLMNKYNLKLNEVRKNT